MGVYVFQSALNVDTDESTAALLTDLFCNDNVAFLSALTELDKKRLH